MTVNGTPEQIKYLIEQQAVRSMCALLGVRDPTVSQLSFSIPPSLSPSTRLQIHFKFQICAI